jgi:predicted O-linked N-acetylglucosamine transferase (SPINDLY family)
MLLGLLKSAFGGGAQLPEERGIALWQAHRLGEAERELRKAAARRRGSAGVLSNLGMVIAAQGRMDEAVEVLGRAVTIDPRHAGARINFAAILREGGALPEAVAHLREALAIEPENRTARANLIRPLMELCDWDAVRAAVGELCEDAARGAEGWADAIPPFESLLLPLPPELRLRIARHHASQCELQARSGRPVAHPRRPPADPHKRLRVAYVSADFHDHATAHLSGGLYGAHDRSQCEVFAYSIGRPDTGEYRRRIASSCDRFAEVGALSGDALAQRIADDGIDIVVDMKGYTGGCRPDVLARRPAPLQVSFLGYPGTMGAGFIDYLIADRIVVPPAAERFYAEKIVRMPASYQVNDGAQPIAPAPPERASAGLPPAGFVFCCFNQPFKIEAGIFAAWMRILGAVPGSVLWLQGGHAEAERRLRAAAASRGVDPARLVFARYARKPEHLARIGLAGLFLDTHSVNAHTTASDALWAGVPIISWPGESFASRVAASLLHAVGLADCIMSGLEPYERRAIELASRPDERAALRARLLAGRGPLFDTAAYARALEAAYRRMWTLHAAGTAPASFPVD